MRQSIRYRFTLIFIGLTALILLATWCINNWLLEDFYVMEKLNVLEDAFNQVNEIVVESSNAGKSISDEFQYRSGMTNEEPGSLAQVLREFGDKSNITVVIYDSISDTTIRPSSRDADFLFEKVKRYILGINSTKSETLREHDNYVIQRAFDNRSKSYYLESWGFFADNRTVFIMSTPLASISESVELSNKFLAYVGVAALLCSSVIMYFTTKKVTSPILQLASLSEKMTKLDFDAKYTGDSPDEIGVLGHSMNLLSDRLKETIGELKCANNELKQDIEQKIQVDEMRKEFIANVSHELKTPIALIQGYAEGLTEGMCEDKESRDYYCEVIMDEANRMNKMVRQLLNLTALEFGNDHPAMERFDLRDLIQGIITSSKIMIQQKEAKVIFEASDPIWVWADEFKIEEVFTNYFSNALNHLEGERQITITALYEEEAVRVSVFNTGHSIPEEDIPNLWTKFYKVDKARTREYGGSGIGLSIVKAIIESHHKEYGVENVDKGVVFWFTLDSGKIG